MLDELVWMAGVLRADRVGVSAGQPTSLMTCPICGTEMNQHAAKVDYAGGRQLRAAVDPDFQGVVQKVHQCTACGNIELQATTLNCARTNYAPPISVISCSATVRTRNRLIFRKFRTSALTACASDDPHVACFEAVEPVLGDPVTRHARPLQERSVMAVLRAGDESAFSLLVDTYQTRMLRVARVYVTDKAATEEVVQETWMRVLRNIDRFESRSTLKTWIFRILVNTAMSWASRERRSIAFSRLAGDAEGDQPGGRPGPLSASGRTALARSLDLLSD
jgi:hypothetical protein